MKIQPASLGQKNSLCNTVRLTACPQKCWSISYVINLRVKKDEISTHQNLLEMTGIKIYLTIPQATFLKKDHCGDPIFF